MKKLYLLVLIFLFCTTSFAQWSNTTNQFYDTLHMSVSTEFKTQANPVVIQSYPDSGYFVIWEDFRNDPVNNAREDIYAQKYDKNGNQLWANNGEPVATGPNKQHYTVSSNQDYRNRAYAATDSAGGFYITYVDDSVSNYVWQRLCVQHIRSDGSAVFPGVGYILARSATANHNLSPQLIADGNKGFFVSYATPSSIHIACYRDDNGTLQFFGGGTMTDNAIQRIETEVCVGTRYFIVYPQTTVIDYNIWTDLQGGCNIVMQISGNTGEQYGMLAFNKLFRAKKNSISTQPIALGPGSKNKVTSYGKDSVYPLYSLIIYDTSTFCGGNPSYVVPQTYLLQNGYQLIDGSYTSYNGGGYDYNYAKGTIVSTPGNINVSFIAVLRRTYQNNIVSNFTVQGYGLREEKYDSIPYQRASTNSATETIFPLPPPGIDKLNNFRDTLLAQGGYYFDFSLAGGGNQIYSSALFAAPGTNTRDVRLQHLAVERKTADSFAVEYATDTKNGVLIGKESASASGYIFYDFPLLSVNNSGNALFYIRENSRSARVSPVFNGAELAWGAMGKLIGSGIINNRRYNFHQPFVALNPLNGTGLIGWKDDRPMPGSPGENIFMRHLDNLNDPNYTPPNKLVRIITNPFGATAGNPLLLTGSSKRYSVIEATSTYGSNPGTSPVVEILDNYNLGRVQVSVFQNTGAIRNYNGKPYLDRNFSITPENNPPPGGSAVINIRFFFTTNEFDALKAADPTITSPGDLAIVKQPATGSAPASYIFVAGEQKIVPQSWSAVEGGYYIEIEINSFSNFFIMKNAGALPVTWLEIQAKWLNSAQASINWHVAQQVNVKDYTVQHSINGNSYTDVCIVAGSSQTKYVCVVPASVGSKNYYRVMEQDIDGKKSFSKVVTLQGSTLASVGLYPNPANDKLYINGLTTYRKLQIADAEGRVIHRQNILQGMEYLNVRHLASGIYVLTVIGDNNIQTLKFIKN